VRHDGGFKMEKTQQSVIAPCSNCVGKKTHTVLFTASDSDESVQETFAMLRCAGCQTISMGRQQRYLPNGEIEHTYYPSPVSRKKPSWTIDLIISFGNEEEQFANLLSEIYEAIDGGQHRLAAMGIRALLEQVMISQVGDLQTFEEKLDAFQEKGLISKVQRVAMGGALEMGHAAMHRSFKPTGEELSQALDIVEGILAPIYNHTYSGERISRRIPPRAPKK
jgi:hypothetical protein